MIKFHREKHLTHIPFRTKRARVRNSNKKRKNAEESTQRAALMNRTLFAKATLLPSAVAVKEEAAIVMMFCKK